WSYTLPVEKFAKVPVKGIFPPIVIPAAIPIIFASAIPIWKNRSGWFFLNSSILREPVKSAQRATTSLFFFPSSVSPSPKPERVSFWPESVYFFIWFFFIFNNLRGLRDFGKGLFPTVGRLAPFRA